MMEISNRSSWLVMGFLLILCFLGINRDLWTPDEPREAEIGREMLLSPGVVPTLNGQDFIEKPPLYYWAVAGAYQLFGGPSAAAARSVSVVASLLTLLLVFLWGRRDFSAPVGLVAVAGLVTSTQFAMTSRGIVIDPLLMLFITVAVWAGYDLIRGCGRTRTLFYFYASLALALWTKGLIGPVLMASGLLVYLATRRSISPIWRLRPIIGIGIMILTIAGLMALIYVDAGFEAVREWFWVNHVQRFVDPSGTGTGHKRPFYEYIKTLPLAVFPWWLPFISLFKPGPWRDKAAPNHDLKVYLGAVCIGMFLILSASSTKRGLYLMPLLPPLFLLLANEAMAWWQNQPAGPLRGFAWWLQVGLVGLFGLGPTILVMGYLRVVDPIAVVLLLIEALLILVVIVFSLRGDKPKAFMTLAAVAFGGIVVMTLAAFPIAGSMKDMSPYLSQVKQRLPVDQQVYVTGNIDETARGIVPFVMGREIVEISASELYDLQPDCVIVQDKNGGKKAPLFEAPYTLQHERAFGPRRYMALWCRTN